MKKIIFVMLVMVLAILPRIWKLSSLPPRVVDEPANIRDIHKLQKIGGFHPIDFEWGYGQATLVHYPTITLINLGVKDEFLALRLTSVIMSLLALIPFYCIVKRYTNAISALCTTILFSSSYYYLQFSRVGWTNMTSLTLGLFFIWIITAMNPTYWKSALAGFLGGILLYTYRSGELYLAVGSLWFLIFTIKNSKSWKKNIIHVGIFFSLLFLTSAPWLATIASHWERYTLRERVVSIWNISLPYHGALTQKELFMYQFITTIKSWILMIPTDSGGLEGKRYLPLTFPPISYSLIPIYIIGLCIALKKWKTFWLWIFILCLSLIFGQILTIDPPNGSRGLLMLPVIYLFCGLTISEIFKYFPSFWIQTILTGTVAAIALGDILFYWYWMEWIQM